jgi:hypothetical protein
MKTKFFRGAYAVLMCVMVAMLFGCTENKLKASVEEANKKCPEKIGSFAEITSITYEGNEVVFTMTMDEMIVNIDALNSNPEALKSAFVAGMRDKSNNILDLLIKENADFCMVIRGKTSGKELKIQLSVSELKEEMKKPKPTQEDKLALIIASANQQMPMDTGTGIIMTKLEDKGDVVLYYATVANKAQFQMIAENTESVKNSQKMMFKMLGQVEKKFFLMIAEAGRGLGYSYSTEGSNETVKIIFSNEELKEIFDN